MVGRVVSSSGWLAYDPACGTVDHRHELGACVDVLFERSQQRAGQHGYAVFVNAPRRHAMVGGFDDNRDAVRRKRRIDAVGDLRGKLFLYL